MTCGSSMPLSSAVAPLLRAVGSRNVTSVALGHLPLILVLAAYCLGVFALSHFFASVILFLGSSLRGRAHGDVQPVRDKQRRLSWTHYDISVLRTFTSTTATYSRRFRETQEMPKTSHQTPSPEKHEFFRTCCWTPCKEFWTAKSTIEELLRADVSRQRRSLERAATKRPRRQPRRRMSVVDRRSDGSDRYIH